VHLDAAGLDPQVRGTIEREVDAFALVAEAAERPERALIFFDAHPGNFLITRDDTWGLALSAGLVLKEVPFLFLMLLSALQQADAERSMVVARTLGYGRIAAWLKVVLPRVYPQMRLPVLAVLAYSLSVVDVSLVLGPSTPPTLPVQILKWSNDPDLSFHYRASAGAILQLLLVAASCALWLAGERLVARVAGPWIESGHRTAGEFTLGALSRGLGIVIVALVASAFLSIVLWSFADAWRYPNPLPSAFTLRNWQSEGARAGTLLANSLLIAGAASAVALVLVIGCLENEVRNGRSRPDSSLLWLLYLPLLAPQIAFLLGMQMLLIQFRLNETFAGVFLAHLVFTLPYVFLSLADPWRAFDDRYRQVALTLGASPARVLVAIRLPMLLRAVLAAAAIGIAVSNSWRRNWSRAPVGQRLPRRRSAFLPGVTGVPWPSMRCCKRSSRSAGS
jgi:putative thiamine transport system permease protein